MPFFSFKKRFTCGSALSRHAGHDTTLPVFFATASAKSPALSRSSVGNERKNMIDLSVDLQLYTQSQRTPSQ